MTSIMISIHPEWVIKIFNGDKIAEIRKDAPKEWVDYLSGKTNVKPEPMTGYIYCAKGKPYVAYIDGKLYTQGDSTGRGPADICLNGKVVASFTLREVEEIHRVGVFEGNPSIDAFATNTKTYAELLEESCLKETEMDEYLTSAKKTVGYAWHISELQIFDKPMELEGFLKPNWDKGLDRALKHARKEDEKVSERIYNGDACEDEIANCEELTLLGFELSGVVKRAPQSWCYVETRK